MHDQALRHKALCVIKFFDEKNVKRLPWPENSLDMNPVENLWAIVKRKIKKFSTMITKYKLRHIAKTY